MTDKEFYRLVRSVARMDASKLESDSAWDYLTKNWDRLSETPHGRFMREVYNSVPDLLLKRMYRKEVLNVSAHEPYL